MNKKYLIYILLTVTALEIHAQNSKIDPTLEVKRDYDTRILEIRKSKLSTDVADSIKKINIDFSYSIFNKPIKELYEFKPLPSASIERNNRPTYPNFYFKTGLNYPLNGYAELYYTPDLPSNYSLLLFGIHNSFYGKMDLNDHVHAPQSVTSAGAIASYSWKTGEIGLKTHFDHNQRSYYGFSMGEAPAMAIEQRRFMTQNLSHTFMNTGASLFIKSTNSNPTHFYYSIEAGYNRLKDNGHLNHGFNNTVYDDTFSSEITIGPNFATHHKLMLTANIELNTDYQQNKSKSITLNPYYSFTHNRWYFELGGKISRCWDSDDKGYDYFIKGSASIELIPTNLWFYATVDGNNEFLTYTKLLKMNPWVTPYTKIQKIHTPLETKSGFKGQLSDRFSYNIFAGYSIISSQIFFDLIQYKDGTHLGNSFEATYLQQKRLTFGGEVSWKSRDFEMGVNVEYHQNKNADNHPMSQYAPLTALSYFRYSWRERIIFSGKSTYRSSTDILPSFLKIDTELEYAHNKQLSFFVRLNNILNAQECYYENYYSIGFNVGGGITFRF